VLIWLLFIFFKRAITKWRYITNPLYQSVFVGILASMASLLILNIFGCVILTSPWITVIAVSIGISEKILQLENIA